MIYDVWTRSRVPIGFAHGPHGAIFAYRWDAGGDHVNWLATAHNGFGIDREPMRDFDDGDLVARFGIRHSILTIRKGEMEAGSEPPRSRVSILAHPRSAKPSHAHQRPGYHPRRLDRALGPVNGVSKET